MSDRTATGYSGKALWAKLGLRAGLRTLVCGAPGDYAVLTGFDTDRLQWVVKTAGIDFGHAFVRSRAELDAILDELVPHLEPAGQLWVSWPKRSSGVATDLTEDGVRAAALPRGLVDVKVCAVDAVWSGLKLVWRRERRPPRKT